MVGIGLALTGLGLVASIGTGGLRQPWLLVALSIYFANLAIAFFIQRPSLRLVGIRRPPTTRQAGASSASATCPTVAGLGWDDRVPDELGKPCSASAPQPDRLFCRIVAGGYPVDPGP